MDGLDVQQFISTQRTKLSQEKARLFDNPRSPRGIVPSGSQMSRRAERLRQERQEEYQDFLKARERAPNSVAEIRRDIAREREREIGSNDHAITNRSGERETQDRSTTVSDYNSLRNQRLEEERQYRGGTFGSGGGEVPSQSRRRWDDEPPQQRVRFEERGRSEVMNRGYSRGWEDDERELMTWARGRGQSRHVTRTRTPPDTESPRSKVNLDAHKSTKLRSISAPVVHDHHGNNGGNGGILGLGGGVGDNMETRRNKQKEYAEILRAQIKEREEARQRERVKEELQDRKDDMMSREKSEQNLKLARDEYQHKERSPPHHNDHDRYAPYRPPPSRFNDHPYYGPPSGPGYNYQAHYYPYFPPRPPARDAPSFDYYAPDPYHNPYYHPSYHYPRPPPPPHPRGENPYFPPRHDMRRSPPHRRQWDNDDDYGDDYSTRTRKRDYRTDFESARRNRDHPSRDRGNGEETSPLHGGGGSGHRGPAMDKAAYRAELNRQMKEKKENDLKAKLKREMEDSKKEAEIYDPFGKGGCGAPVRDQHGNLVADLKQMRKLNEERLNLSTSPSHHATSDGDQPNDSPRTIFTYDKVDQETQKLSTHTTYRDFLKQQVEEKERKKEEEKRLQMVEEQRELERLERDRKKLEEDFKRERERERQREEEAKRKNEQMKREAEEKKREAARKAEEEQRREAEREREIAEAKLRALAERMSQPLPQQYQQRAYSPPIPTLRNKTNNDQNTNNPPRLTLPQEQPVQPVQPVFRTSSPPVPAVLKKMAEEQKAIPQVESMSQVPPREESPPPLQWRQSSPVLPAPAHSEPSHPPRPAPPRKQVGGDFPYPPTLTSVIQPAPAAATATTDQPTDILKQLAAMRMHLQSELAKKDAAKKPDRAEIFERALQQKPRMPGPRIARPKDSAMLNALNQFTHLKYNNPTRREFVSKYPEQPDTESVLEFQQGALLRHQEQQLAHLKEKERGEPAAERHHHDPHLLDDPLASDSVNLPLDDRGDPFQDTTNSYSNSTTSMTSRATSMATGRAHTQAKPVGRRRQWGEGGGGGGGGGVRVPSAGGQSQFSVATVDVDSMAVRNDERARRLDAILNAGVSNNNSSWPHGAQHHHHLQEDPQIILHDFLRRRGHGGSSRSEHSLDCETDYQRISSPHS